jgi:bifunctional DNase/RNase
MNPHECSLLNVAIEATSQAPLILLQSQVDGRVLPIMIGIADLERLYYYVSNISTGRPSTHNLMLEAIGHLGGEVEQVEISSYSNLPPAPGMLSSVQGVFLASVTIASRSGESYVLDSRPSDAISLAIITGAPILIAEEVLDEHGLTFEGQQLGSREIEEEIRDFRTFLDDISPEQFRLEGDDNGAEN